MAKFSISLSIEVDAEDYDAAYELEKSITRALEADPEINAVYSIDVEQTSEDDEYDGQPDEAQEWHDFDPDC